MKNIYFFFLKKPLLLIFSINFEKKKFLLHIQNHQKSWYFSTYPEEEEMRSTAGL